MTEVTVPCRSIGSEFAIVVRSCTRVCIAASTETSGTAVHVVSLDWCVGFYRSSSVSFVCRCILLDFQG